MNNDAIGSVCMAICYTKDVYYKDWQLPKLPCHHAAIPVPSMLSESKKHKGNQTPVASASVVLTEQFD